MQFTEAIQLIEDGKYTNIKIVDTDNKRILDIDGETPQSLVDRLQKVKPQLLSYGRVKFIVATEAIKRANWKDAYHWNITFQGETGNTVSTTHTNFGNGFISANEAALMAQLSGLQKEMEFNKRFDELSKKLDDNDPLTKYMPMLPLLGLFIDIKPEKIQAMNALGNMGAAFSGKGAGMAGLVSTEAEPKVKGTPEEEKMIKSINDNLEKLSEKVDIAKIDEFIKTLNEKPEFLTMLIQMSQNYK